MNTHLRGVAEFVQAVEAGSFSLAAQKMNLSRSAIGKAVAKLEQRLGVRLFNRTTRTHHLTEEGRIYYQHCARAVAELNAAEVALSNVKTQPTGCLRVSSPIVFGRHYIAPLLIKLGLEHDGMDVDLSFSDRNVDVIKDKFDLVIRVGELEDTAELVARTLGYQRMCLCASPTYLEEHGRPTDIEDLQNLCGINYGSGSFRIPWRLPDAQGFVLSPTVSSRLTMDDMQAILDATVTGFGVAWLPNWLISSYLEDGQLETLFGQAQMYDTQVHVLWPKNNYLPLKTRVAIDMLVEEIPSILDV